MRKATFVRTLAFGLATTGFWLGQTQAPPAGAQKQKGPPPDLNVIKVSDDLHVLEGSGGNVAVYTTSEGVILVDDKFDQNHQQILDKVKTITEQPIRYVLNTHQHGDHTGGNARMMARGVDTFAHENARLNMEKGRAPGLPRITFTETLAINLGGKQVRAYHFGRAHTNGDAVIYFPALKIVHMGDMFVSGAPLVDFANGASVVSWPETLGKVAAALDFDTTIPGHGPVGKKADLLAWRKTFEAVTGRITGLKRQGKTKEEAAGLMKYEDFPGWATFATRGFSGAFDELK